MSANDDIRLTKAIHKILDHDELKTTNVSIILDTLLTDFWVNVELSNGDVLDIDAPELHVLEEQLKDPDYRERYGVITIVKRNLMSRVAVGIR
jgi:hypothetical protein